MQRLMPASCWRSGLEGDPNRDFWSRQSLPVPVESASQGSASSAAPAGASLLRLKLLASFFLSLDSHLHGPVSSASAFWTPFPLRCFRELCLASACAPLRGPSAGCGLSPPLLSDAFLPAPSEAWLCFRETTGSRPQPQFFLACCHCCRGGGRPRGSPRGEPCRRLCRCGCATGRVAPSHVSIGCFGFRCNQDLPD